VSDLFFSWVDELLSELVQITRFSKTGFYDLIRKLDRRKKKKILEPQLPPDGLSKTIVASVTETSRGPVPDCLTCGVCCAYALIVPVSRKDTARLLEYWDITLDDTECATVIGRVLPRNPRTGYCSNLNGRLGKKIDCRIYAERPSVCREFEAGSDRCHEYRRMYGLEPQLGEADIVKTRAELSRFKRGVITFVSIVIDSVSTRVSFSADDPGRIGSEKVTYLKIVAFLDDDEQTEYEIHSYDSSKENWFESDLIGMTLQEAKQVIESRS
jgi:Fe-S-cluster containining protein